MKKNFFAVPIMCIVMGLFVLVACNRDNEFVPFGKGLSISTKDGVKQDEALIIVESKINGNIVDRYSIEDKVNSIWSWNREENGVFVHDFDFFWDHSDEAFSVCKEDDSSYVVTFEDGEKTIISKAVANKNQMAFKIRYNTGEECQIMVILPFEADLIEGLLCYANGMSLPSGFSPEDGAIFRKILKAVKDFLRNAQQCRSEVAKKANDCSMANCLPWVSDNGRSVTCLPNPLGGGSNCGEYTHIC